MAVIYTFIHVMDFLKVGMLSIVKNYKCLSGSDFEGSQSGNRPLVGVGSQLSTSKSYL